MAHEVFISYCFEDKLVSDALCAAIEAAGIRCWIAPRDVLPGPSYGGQITRAVKASRVLVLVFSAHSNVSQAVLAEVEVAAGARIHIINFRIDDSPLSDDLLFYLRHRHWLDALTTPMERHYQHLVKSVQALLCLAPAGHGTQLPGSAGRDAPSVINIPGEPAAKDPAPEAGDVSKNDLLQGVPTGAAPEQKLAEADQPERPRLSRFNVAKSPWNRVPRGWSASFIGVVIVCIIAVFYFEKRQGPEFHLAILPSQPPMPHPQVAATATPAPSIANTLPSASASRLSPDAAMNAALLQAEKYEAAQDWLHAIQAYVDFNRSFPTVDAGRIRLESLLISVDPTLEKMSPDEFAPYRPTIADAASQDVVGAMVILASQLRSIAPTEAFNWFCAASARGNSAATTQVGLMISNGDGVPRDLARAARWFQMAANGGDDHGRTCLADCYLYGDGVPKDPPHAVALLQDSADDGDPRAIDLLGGCYHQGNGVPKNDDEAFKLFSRAHDLGLPSAAANLGVLYMNGDGVPHDWHKGVSLFVEGAQEGSANAMYLLAECLDNGDGVSQNPNEAQVWYRKAAAAGFPKAIAWCNSKHIPIPKASP
jgi:TPR repeat protein